MDKKLRIIYVTANVLGDAGANAADIFPRLSAKHAGVAQTIVADAPRNKTHILDRQGAEYLRLHPNQSLARQGFRIARKARQEKTDVIHMFYRQKNAILLIWIRVFLVMFGARARILMDHRSVNLATGWRGWAKRMANLIMQPFAHVLAGNPCAVETNHPIIRRPHRIIDLGYDTLPDFQPKTLPANAPINVWFVGSLKPKNRKTRFLIEIFRALSGPEGRRIAFHVAGPARVDQIEAMTLLSRVTYHGMLPRSDLYDLMSETPGIGLAYMNREYHEFAPSLKFAEYAAFRFGILASDTVGLKTQGSRMGLDQVTYLPERVEIWAREILRAAEAYSGPAPVWLAAPDWSYDAIWNRQVLPLYQELAARSENEIPGRDIDSSKPGEHENIAITKINAQTVHRV